MASCFRNFLQCHCLGEKLCGTDVDELFAYQTPKVVKIKDRTLGLTKMALLLSIFLYIIVYQVAYNGEHFRVEDIEGTFRLQWQQPTKGWCNPMDVECDDNIDSPNTLPYCKQFDGAEDQKAPFQATCSIQDAWELPIIVPSGVLMPTYVEKYAQTRICEHNESDCSNKYKFSTGLTKDARLQTGEGEAEPMRANFIGAVEDFTVLIDHGFATTSGSMAYDDFRMKGFWTDCSKGRDECVRKPIKCLHDWCHKVGTDFIQEIQPPSSLGAVGQGNHSNLRKKNARPADSFLDVSEGSEAEMSRAMEEAAKGGPSVISIKDGDVLSLKTMLQIAMPSSSSQKQPEGGYSLQDVVNSQGDTMRRRGSALVIRIDYDNYDHWRLASVKTPPEYTISAKMRPAREFKHLQITEQLPGAREFEKAYGILIVVQQTGKIRTVSMMNALIVVTAALGLLAVSNVLTDFLALYLMPRSLTYTELKYQESEDLVTVGHQHTMPEKDGDGAAAAAAS